MKKSRAECPGFSVEAVRKGLEPSTSGVTGRHSNQLNYRTNLFGVFSNADAKISTFFDSANFYAEIF